MPSLQPHDVSGLDIHPSHSAKVWAAFARLFPSLVTVPAGDGMGWAATAGVPTSKTLTGSASAAPLVFDVTKHARGRRIESIDLAYTVTATGSVSTSTLTVVEKASLVNDDYFSLLNAGPDGETIVFFYDLDGGSSTPVDATHIKVDIAADTTANEVAITTRAAINAIAGIKWDAAVPVGAAITLTSDDVGAEYNVTHTENVANAGFTITAATGGLDESLDALTVAVEALRMEEDGTAPTFTSVAAFADMSITSAHDSDTILAAGADKLVSLRLPSYEVVEGDGQIVRIVGDLAQAGDSLILKAIRVNFASDVA